MGKRRHRPALLRAERTASALREPPATRRAGLQALPHLTGTADASGAVQAPPASSWSTGAAGYRGAVQTEGSRAASPWPQGEGTTPKGCGGSGVSPASPQDEGQVSITSTRADHEGGRDQCRHPHGRWGQQGLPQHPHGPQRQQLASGIYVDHRGQVNMPQHPCKLWGIAGHPQHPHVPWGQPGTPSIPMVLGYRQ